MHFLYDYVVKKQYFCSRNYTRYAKNSYSNALSADS